MEFIKIQGFKEFKTILIPHSLNSSLKFVLYIIILSFNSIFLNQIKKPYLTLLSIWQLRPSWQGHEWCKLKTSPPRGSSHMSPSFKYLLQMLSPCSLAQHSPGWQSLDVLHRLLSVPLVLGARHRPHKHFNPLQQFPSLLQISFRIRHRSHLREYRLHDSLLSQSLLEVHIWFEMKNMINSFVKKYIQFTFLLREKWKGKTCG